MEFPGAINYIMQHLGRDTLCVEDIIDLFDIIDINGDHVITKQELVKVFLIIDFLSRMSIEQRNRNGLNYLLSDETLFTED